MFTVSDMRREVARLYTMGARELRSGSSVLGEPIPCFAVGEGRPLIIVTAAIHARENLTSPLVLRQAEYALKNKTTGGTIVFLPMLNPDGVNIVDGGEPFVRANAVPPVGNYAVWKANASAVDLNVNFDARWGSGAQNITRPAHENFIGRAPFSEPETAYLASLTKELKPDATVSYHAKGRVLYWYFHQSEPHRSRDRALAERLIERTGYALGKASTDSAGGYKDWCIESFGIPAFTIEIISDEWQHPLPSAALTYEEMERNRDLPLLLISLLSRPE